ncbi:MULTISPECIES: DUF2935 domain-containing protein [Pelosinus]|uniref:DUF2935 domain-containing protein n=1 Tax=Pelosinus fermentans B4 TaxID=1149862 RepID=I9LAK7_9FIRM|nr:MULTISPECIES: DUF2935 domain-containing protein [Pelosinus]EIW17444.1 Protein of unknown function DUF2935 [Pelosinus fermentans B4]EIW23504.1 hypothetical protein FA11_4196 [Pelosinus fermentans A11]OAM91999.1 Protein of unknown function DUF2935 [Pelosinus fermentans DSM 17108]SDQ30514.1 protein of unknown function [Pelosinus fermentans]
MSSRQLMSYMVPEPLEPLNLEEVKFWIRIMEEHALFIKSGLPCECEDLIDDAQAFYQEFESLRVRAERLQNDKKFMELVTDTQALLKEFYTFKRDLLHRMLECKLGGYNFPLFLDHMAREAEYFMRLLDKIKNGKVALSGGAKAQENVFWLRILADHAKFISHLLDPSERNLIQTANSFSQEFDDLYLQGRDFSSMLQGYPEVASFKRFLQDVRAAVLRIRDFKRAAEEMIRDCRLVGLIPALLADHVRREADHFLLILTMMEKGIMKNTTAASLEYCDEPSTLSTIADLDTGSILGMMKSEREEEVLPEPKEREPKVEEVPQEKISSKGKGNREKKHSHFESKGKAVEEKLVLEDILIEEGEDTSSTAQVIDTKNSDSKYKWSGKWPRQLGKKKD